MLSHQKQNCFNDLDAQIQEILLRSSPVNDNKLPGAVDDKNNISHPLNEISVVGNNNIIIDTSLWTLLLLSLLVPLMNIVYFYILHK